MLKKIKRKDPDATCRIDISIVIKTKRDRPDMDNEVGIHIGNLLIGKSISALSLSHEARGLKNYGYYSFLHDDYNHWHLRYLPPDYCLTDKGIDMEKLQELSEAFPIEPMPSMFLVTVGDKEGKFAKSLKEIFSIKFSKKDNYIYLENVDFGICHTNNSHTIRIDFGESYRKSLKDKA